MQQTLTQRDPLGRTTTFGYTAGQTTITDPSGSQTIERYTDGQVTSETKAAGTADEATWTYSYGPTNQVATTTDPLGAVTSNTYDARGNLLTTTDPLGRTRTATYDTYGNVTAATDAAGHTTSFGYDAHGNLLTATDPTGAQTRYTINPDGTVATMVDPRGTSAGPDPSDHTTRYGYDQHGNRTSTTDPSGARATATWDSIGRMTAVTDPRGHEPGATPEDYTTHISYDDADQVRSTTDPLGHATTSTYDAAGNLLQRTDPLGRITRYRYDLANQTVEVTDPTGATTSFEYDAVGRIDSVTDPRGKTTHTAYNPLGQPTRTVDAIGNATTYTYDKAGRLTTITRPGGGTTSRAYDAAGQLTTVTDPNGHSSNYGYDADGRRTHVTDPEHRTQITTYDAADRPTGITRNDGTDLQWTYDRAGNVRTYTDAADYTTSYTYDNAGRRATSTDPANRTTRYSYDTAGHPVVVTSPDAKTTHHSYDRAGRLTGTDYSDPGTVDVTYSYDAVGQRSAMTDGTGTTHYAYDDNGRLTSQARGATTVGYTYDLVGRLTTLTYPGDHVVTRAYDDAGRLTGVTDWANRTTAFTWDADNNLDAMTYPNGVTTSQTQDAAGQTTRIHTTHETNTLLDLSYTHTDAGLIATATTAGQASDTATGTASYGYDPLAQLANVTGGATSGAYDIDNSGNLTELPGGIQQTFDSAGQLTRRTIQDAETTTYDYDTHGNRTTATTAPTPGTPGSQLTNYTYDAADRLTMVNTPTGTSQHTYDGDGLRVHTTRATGQTTEQQSYVWDLADDLPLLLTDGDHDYVYGPGTAPIAQIDTATGAVQYLHGDRTGSTRAVTNTDGTIAATYICGPYGDLTSSTSPNATRFQYAGQYTDPDTGLQYLRARYYDPTTAQFLTRDPLEDTTKAPYSYAGGNPLLFTDPTGLDWLDDVGDWTAGFGDTITLGGTKQVRRLINYSLNGDMNDIANACSDFYTWGGRGGMIASLIPIGAIGRAGARVATAAAPEMRAGFAARASVRNEIGAIGEDLKFNADQQALLDLAKHAKRSGRLGLDDAETLVSWAEELGVRSHRPQIHPGRPGFGGTTLHINVGKVKHIKVQP